MLSRRSPEKIEYEYSNMSRVWELYSGPQEKFREGPVLFHYQDPSVEMLILEHFRLKRVQYPDGR